MEMREAVGEKENKKRCGEEWEWEKMRRVTTREDVKKSENEKRWGRVTTREERVRMRMREDVKKNENERRKVWEWEKLCPVQETEFLGRCGGEWEWVKVRRRVRVGMRDSERGKGSGEYDLWDIKLHAVERQLGRSKGAFGLWLGRVVCSSYKGGEGVLWKKHDKDKLPWLNF